MEHVGISHKIQKRHDIGNTPVFKRHSPTVAIAIGFTVFGRSRSVPNGDDHIAIGVDMANARHNGFY